MKASFQMKYFVAFLLILTVCVSSTYSRASRIMGIKAREDIIADLERLLNFEDQEFRDSIPAVVSPFYFEQPLVLKLRAPGGLNDDDLLQSIGEAIASEVSGAFVRGSRRSLLMKNGELIKEGDSLTRIVEEFGGLETSVSIEKIERDGFVLKLNDSSRTVELLPPE